MLRTALHIKYFLRITDPEDPSDAPKSRSQYEKATLDDTRFPVMILCQCRLDHSAVLNYKAQLFKLEDNVEPGSLDAQWGTSSLASALMCRKWPFMPSTGPCSTSHKI